MEQYCTLYAASESPPGSDAPPLPSLLVLTPIIGPDAALPYYHPTVYHLAFRYIPSSQSLRIEALPLPGTPLDFSSRLHRTCLALLETLHRYGWGAQTQYKKRVAHDCLVSREVYQDLYLVMRERHKHLVGEWKEVTDPLKHVFEVCQSFCPIWLLLIFIHSGYRNCHFLDTSVEGNLRPVKYSEGGHCRCEN